MEASAGDAVPRPNGDVDGKVEQRTNIAGKHAIADQSPAAPDEGITLATESGGVAAASPETLRREPNIFAMQSG